MKNRMGNDARMGDGRNFGCENKFGNIFQTQKPVLCLLAKRANRKTKRKQHHKRTLHATQDTRHIGCECKREQQQNTEKRKLINFNFKNISCAVRVTMEPI